MSRTPQLAGIAAASFALFVTPAAVFWIGTNTNGGHSSASDWARVVGEAGSWTVLPVVVLAVCFSLLLAGRWMEARFVLLVVAGAGLLMYAARIVLQALGADDRGGRLSDYPSGNTAATAVFVGALTVLVWSGSRSVRVRALAAGSATGVVVAMSWARAAGGRHTVLDVVGGVALGLSWLVVCVPASRRWMVAR